MKILLLAFAKLALTADAFGVAPGTKAYRRPSKSSTALSGLLGKFISSRIPEVLEGVHLPHDEPIPDNLLEVLNLNFFTNVNVVKYLMSSSSNELLEGEPKTEGSLKEARDVVMDVAKLDANVPSNQYKYWGNPDNRVEEMIVMLKSNPFMAQALTEAEDGGFELKSYDPDDPNPSRYLQYINTLVTGAGHRVNFKFSDKMEFESFTVFDDVLGVPIQADDANKYAGSAIFNLLFYASCVHATMHVLHFLTTSALTVSSDDFEEMHEWACTYEKNIAIKYLEVGVLLIKPPADPGKHDLGILTGPDGFGTTQAVRPLLQNVLNDWGMNPTLDGFMDKFYNISPEKMEDAGILTEFRKHTALVVPFAQKVTDALKNIDGQKFSDSQKRLDKYLKSCGTFQSKISTVNEWVQLMAATGLLHGGTLSYTRFIGVQNVMMWRNVLDDKWDAGDINLVTGGLGTVTGMQPGRHVMTKGGGGPKLGFAHELQQALDDFDEKATKLKNEYERDLIGCDDFNDLGFILSDYCKDNFDGKQLTMATYI